MPTYFSTTRRVEFADTDMAGIVHFAMFFRYLEDAEHEFFRTLGLSIMQSEEDGWVVSWPRVAASCSYDAPAFFDEVVEARLVGLEIGNRSLTFAWDIWRDETRLCSGELKTVCCRFRPGERPKSIDIPQDIRAKFEATLAP